MSSPFDTGDVSSPFDTGAVSSPFDTGAVSSPFDTGAVSTPFDTGDVTSSPPPWANPTATEYWMYSFPYGTERVSPSPEMLENQSFPEPDPFAQAVPDEPNQSFPEGDPFTQAFPNQSFPDAPMNDPIANMPQICTTLPCGPGKVYLQPGYQYSDGQVERQTTMGPDPGNGISQKEWDEMHKPLTFMCEELDCDFPPGMVGP